MIVTRLGTNGRSTTSERLRTIHPSEHHHPGLVIVRHFTGNLFPDQFQLHLLEHLLLRLKLPLGIHIVLSVQPALDRITAFLVLADLRPFEAGIRQFELGLQGVTQRDDAFIKLLFQRLGEFLMGLQCWMLVGQAIYLQLLQLGFLGQVFWIERLNRIVGKGQARGVGHELVAIVFQQTLDDTLQLRLLTF